MLEGPVAYTLLGACPGLPLCLFSVQFSCFVSVLGCPRLWFCCPGRHSCPVCIIFRSDLVATWPLQVWWVSSVCVLISASFVMTCFLRLLGAAPMPLFRLVHPCGQCRSPHLPSVFSICFRDLSGFVDMGCVPVCPCLCLIGCLALLRVCGFSWACGFGDFPCRLFLHPSHFWCSVSFLRGATTFCFFAPSLLASRIRRHTCWRSVQSRTRFGMSTSPTPLTRFTDRLCCGLLVFTFLRSFHGSTAVIVMTVPSSLALVWRLLRLFCPLLLKRREGEVGEGGRASFCTAAPSPTNFLSLLTRTGEVGEGGWESWR